MLEAYLSALDLDYFEVTEAFRDLSDENVWRRPAEGLLSVGELAGHMAYWEAARLAGEGKVHSPLIDERFRYHPSTLTNPPTEEHLAMTADQVCKELLRVHEESVAHFRALNPDLGSHVPGWPPELTYGESLKYLVFHVAYHTGQIYSARHLLGETTPDN